MNKQLKDNLEFILTKGKENSSMEYSLFFLDKILPSLYRNEYYQIVQCLIEKYSDDDYILQELYEIELSLIGHCSEVFIIPFIGEPESQDELASYVRGMSWNR